MGQSWLDNHSNVTTMGDKPVSSYTSSPSYHLTYSEFESCSLAVSVFSSFLPFPRPFVAREAYLSLSLSLECRKRLLLASQNVKPGEN